MPRILSRLSSVEIGYGGTRVFTDQYTGSSVSQLAPEEP